MKKLLTIPLILFTLIFSSTSYAEWTKFEEDFKKGTTFYLDFDKIIKHGEYVYWWVLIDFVGPMKSGELSVKIYNQGDCKLSRSRVLILSYHKEPMGGGNDEIESPPQFEWDYLRPGSSGAVMLGSVCLQFD